MLPEQKLNYSYDNLKHTIQIIIDTKITPVESSRIKFLTTRNWWSNEYTEFQKYISKMFPGTHVVGAMELSGITTIPKFDSIHIPNGLTKLTKMQDSKCHDNCVDLYLLNKTNRIFTGYALSDDGLWRFHSWIIDKDDIIIETTKERLIYVGYESTSEYF